MTLTSINELAEVLESTADPAYATNEEGRVIAWNTAAEEFFGYSKSEATGKKCYEIVQGKDVFGNPVCQHSCPIFDLVRKGMPIRRFLMYLRVKAGHYVQGECSTLHVQDEKKMTAVVHLIHPALDFDSGTSSIQRQSRGHPPSKPYERLSGREKEVLQHLAAGRGTREIAEHLHISPATVRTHVQRILQKMGATRRLEAVVIAVREKLI